MNPKSKLLYLFLFSLSLMGCGGSRIISTPVENIDTIPLKIESLSEEEERKWSHLDLISDTVPGISLEKAYSQLIKKKKGKSVTVAIIDSGIDIEHEDLNEVIWVNKGEIPNNGIDDDNNGYIDDINGWNFLGDGYQEQFEYVRIVASGDKSNPSYNRALLEYENNLSKYRSLKKNSKELLDQIIKADSEIAKHLEKENYTKEDLNNLRTDDLEILNYASFLKGVYQLGYDSPKSLIKALKGDLETISEYLDYNLNINFNGREVVGDDPNDFNDRNYGNSNVMPLLETESHGTHVAGIVAAVRNNGIGVNGVANNVKIMALRTIPNGDEYDKDVALAIRYAVDNGARIINTSFGKYFSTNSKWVSDAIVYASENNVLIVSGAGNETYNLDNREYYPNDIDSTSKEISNTFISVGATESKYGSGIVASYSNYGKQNVDVFAPGSNIYSTVPKNKYEMEDGTSMASPTVAGVAALIMSQYPNLTAQQVKDIILRSGLPLKTKVIVDGEIIPFSDISKSSRLVNAFNALLLAQNFSN